MEESQTGSYRHGLENTPARIKVINEREMRDNWIPEMEISILRAIR